MNWKLLVDERPAGGHRVLVDTGKIIIGATIIQFLPGEYVWYTDIQKETFGLNEVLRWCEID